MINQPINFIENNTFVYPKNKRELFNSDKEFIALPKRTKIKINKFNVWGAIKEVYIPISQMCANIQGIQYVNKLPDDCVPFDIETNENDEFQIGYVDNKRFNNPKELIEELLNHECIYGYNILRYDLEILAKYCPEYFYDIKNADFVAKQLKGVITIDLMSIIKILIGLESYSSENVAKLRGYNKERENLTDKDKRCLQDIEMNKFIWEKYNIKKVFEKVSSLANLDITLMQIISTDRLRKWILINKYLRMGYLPLKPEIKEKKMMTEPIKYCKPGFYQDVVYSDLSGAYPRTAINLGNLGIYENDNTFSELQKELLESANDSDLKPFMKSIANPLFGSQYSLNEYFRNENIFNIVVKTIADIVGDIIKKRKDVVYSNTDCFIYPSKCERIRIEGYPIKEKHNFSELQIYNVNKWIGKDNGEIVGKGFEKINSSLPKIFSIAKDEIYGKLKDTKGKKFSKILNKPKTLISKTLKTLKTLDKPYLSISIRKRGETCENIKFFDVWDKLNIGINDVYYTNTGKITFDEKKIGYNYYKELLLEYAESYGEKDGK